MKLQRNGKIAALALTGLLALSACGSDNEGSGSGSGGGASTAPKGDCAEGSITGAGATSQKNAMDEWVKAYQQKCTGATINYQSVGSGAGIEQFISGTADFAGSDSVLKEDQQGTADNRCKTGKAIHLPTVVGPIAVAYSLQGVDNLVLDAKTLAGIFSDKIKTWDDPAIKALNADAKLPSTPIRDVHRSDSSGTSENFTAYLDKASAGAWTTGKSKEWKAAGGEGAKGSEGVSGAVKAAQGGISYMEQSFAENQGLSIASISTGAAAPVKLTAESAGKAVEAAKSSGTGNDIKLGVDYATKAEGAYPIVLVTYQIVCEKGLTAEKVALVKSFLAYTASDEGQKAIADLGYAPVPATVLTKVKTSVEALA